MPPTLLYFILIYTTLLSSFFSGSPVPPHLQVMLAISCMATGSHQNVVGDCYSVSQTTVSVCLKRVATAIASLSHQYIRFPSVHELRRVMRNYYSIANMPGVIGCIDCTHVAIQRPSCDHAEVFRCRKGYFSINVQAICGPDLSFYNVVGRWPGSVHDSRIFRNSQICQQLEAGTYPGHLLGDSGYPCRTYLLTPLQAPAGPKEEAYNTSHIRTRNTIERAFGVLKKMFPYVGRVLRTKLDTSKIIIVASFVLHNIAVKTRTVPHVNEAEGQVAEYLNIAGPDDVQNIQGNAKRRTLIQEYF